MTDHERALIAQYAHRGVLLDTNLLVLFIVGSHDPGRIGSRNTTQYLRKDFQTLVELLEPVTKFVTTPGILAETSNLTDWARAEVRAAHFELLVRFILHTSEEHIPAQQLIQMETYRPLGMTDVAIVAVAQRDVLILTDDFELAIELESQGLPVINFTHIREANLLE